MSEYTAGDELTSTLSAITTQSYITDIEHGFCQFGPLQKPDENRFRTFQVIRATPDLCIEIILIFIR